MGFAAKEYDVAVIGGGPGGKYHMQSFATEKIQTFTAIFYV